MGWNVLERLNDWFRRENTDGDSPGAMPDETAVEEAGSSLFYCDACEVTFISREMATCPRCDRAVEEIESERELDSFHVAE